MVMPEAPIDQNYFPQSWKDQVGRARQGAIMQAESEAHTMDN
jgi:hypothetical protein